MNIIYILFSGNQHYALNIHMYYYNIYLFHHSIPLYMIPLRHYAIPQLGPVMPTGL